MDLLEYSKHNQEVAWGILDNTRIISLWESIGGRVHIVGSLKTGLLIHKDIDMHIYTDRDLRIRQFFRHSKVCGAAGFKRNSV
ncbi:MAG: hypothetical protein LBV74_00835 [Tannerella sp.]|jgi:DNA polymerase/3'-5' exonuclease PolX|nr:hypothetical protein [Tannerella sp.]